MAEKTRKPIYSIHPKDGNEFAVKRHGIPIGELCVHRSGYAEWSFGTQGQRPSRSTQARLLRAARAAQ